MTRRGFTLVEVVVALGITSMVLAGLYQLVFAGSRTTRRAEAANEAMDQVGVALLELSRKVRYAQRIDVPAGTTPSPVLEVTSVDSGTWVFDLDGDRLRGQEKLGFEEETLGRGFSGIRFQRDPENSSLLYVTFERTGPRGTARYRTVLYARGTLR